MVLETRLTFLLVAVSILATACTVVSQPAVTDRASVMGRELRLVTLNDQCILQSEEGDKEANYPLEPKPPCYFSRRDDTLQSFSYPDVNVQATLMVVGTSLTESDREKWGIAEAEYCGEAAQGVLIRNDRLEVTEKPILDGVICRDMGTDEKNFWYFAH